MRWKTRRPKNRAWEETQTLKTRSSRKPNLMFSRLKNLSQQVKSKRTLRLTSPTTRVASGNSSRHQRRTPRERTPGVSLRMDAPSTLRFTLTWDNLPLSTLQRTPLVSYLEQETLDPDLPITTLRNLSSSQEMVASSGPG